MKYKKFINDAYSRNNSPKIKDEAYIINLDEVKSIGTHWIADNMSTSYDATYFYNFGVEHIPKEIKNFIGNKNITKNIYRIQVCISII